MKSIIYLLIILGLFGCRSNEGNEVYVESNAPIDSSQYLLMTKVDKDGKVISEYKSEDFKRIESNAQAMTKNSHHYSVTVFENKVAMDTTTSVIEGNIVAREVLPLKNELKVILLGEEASYDTKIGKDAKFRFFHILPGEYNLFVYTVDNQTTLLKKIEVESGYGYNLIIRKN